MTRPRGNGSSLPVGVESRGVHTVEAPTYSLARSTRPCPIAAVIRSAQSGFSVRVGTPLQDSKLGYQTWAIAILHSDYVPQGRVEHEASP